jgi:tetratricopeptide (TPR) repeat protein
MEQLKAFVGHSFNKDDEKINRTFFDFFDSLKDSANLEWDHAEDAQAIGLSEKVKNKMEGKDLFIGIFTRKDKKIEEKKLRNRLRGKKCGSANDFTWATSEWTIQESGYALGKNMRLLFLIEEGVDISAGLHADIEWVKFNRENSTECFTKISQLLGSIIKEIEKKPVTEMQVTSSDIGKDREEEKEKEEEQKKEESVYTEIFKDKEYLKELIVDEGNLYKAKQELDRIIKEDKGGKFFDQIYWKMMFFKFKIAAGYTDALSEMITLAKENPNESRPFLALANYYNQYHKYGLAAHEYIKVAEMKKEKNERISYIGEAAECYANNKNFKQAYGILLKEFNNNKLDSSHLFNLHKCLSKIAKIEGSDQHFIAFSEKALDYNPSDPNTRFSLAYHYSLIDNNPGALYHYKMLCESNPDGSVWNNIGVAYSRLKIPSKSVDSYKIAREKYGNTLAVANLSDKYIAEGFLDDANSILKKAREVENHHENVDSSISRINDIKNTEENLEKEALGSVDEERNFVMKYAEAYVLPVKLDIEGNWESKHGVISLKVEKERVIGNGEISWPSLSSLASQHARPLDKNALPLKSFNKNIIELEGKICNSGIDYQLTITTEFSPISSLSSKETIYNGLMCINKDASIIEVMERHEKEVAFYEMKRLKG